MSKTERTEVTPAPTAPASAAVAVKMPAKPATIKEVLTGPAFGEQIKMALPKHLAPDRFIRIALTAFNRTPKLLQCSQASVFKCLLDLSAMGLEPDGRRAHLIPYGDECTLIVDYKGLAELVMRSGLVSNLHADVVCENDAFTYDCGEVKQHTIDYRKERGAMYAAYAVARMKDGSAKAEVMAKSEIDAIRARSRAGKAGPWVTDYNEMAKKTVFRRLSKWLPLSPEIRDALEKDGDVIEVDAMRESRDTAKTLGASILAAAKPADAGTVQDAEVVTTGEPATPDNLPMEGGQ